MKSKNNEVFAKLHKLTQLPFNIDKFSCSSESLAFISKLALEHNLSSYGASFLELAIRLEAKINTYDENLIKASEITEAKIISF